MTKAALFVTHHSPVMLRVLAALLFLASHSFAERPEKWPQPVTRIRNFSALTPSLFRSAQPDAAGMRELELRGVRTVISLREYHDDEKPACGTKLRKLHLRMDPSNIKDDDIVRVLAELRLRERGPFLVHCYHGSDRTGVVCAMYRIVEQHWRPCEAIRELEGSGFGFHRMLFTNIPEYLRRTDAEKIRRSVDALAARLRRESH